MLGRLSHPPLPSLSWTLCRSCITPLSSSSRFDTLIGVRYPEELADGAWDNVGLLVGNSETDAKKRSPRVLVTNDLTFQVAVDAIAQSVSVIVSYRMLPLHVPELC